MSPHIRVTPIFALLLLSACFVSEEPRIAHGELLASGPVALCTPDDPPCRIAVPSGDGYIVEADDEEEDDLFLRFEALTEAGGVPVWLGEVELREGDETAWSYIVARPAIAAPETMPHFDIAMPGCGEIAAGDEPAAGVERTDPYACTVTDIARFRAYLTRAYAERFADPAWWADAD